MIIRNATISIIVGAVVGILAYLFMIYNPNFDIGKINELIQSQGIPKGDFSSLTQELERLKSAGLLVNYISSNFYVGILMFLISMFSIFFGTHIVLDKLFFKKFYEFPDYFDAIRRGVFLCLTIALMIYFKILNIEIQFILVLPIIGILLEFGFYNYVKEDFISSLKNLRSGKLKKSDSQTDHLNKTE